MIRGWVLLNMTPRIEHIDTASIYVSYSTEQIRIFEKNDMRMGFVEYDIPYRAYRYRFYICILFDRTNTHI